MVDVDEAAVLAAFDELRAGSEASHARRRVQTRPLHLQRTPA